MDLSKLKIGTSVKITAAIKGKDIIKAAESLVIDALGEVDAIGLGRIDEDDANYDNCKKLETILKDAKKKIAALKLHA